jgi:hypothetical protein
MKRRRLRLSRQHRVTFYAVSLTVFLSGVSWAWVQHLDEGGQATEALRQTKPWLIAIHGLSAMAFVLLLGTLLVSHVRRAWKAGRNRKNGGPFLAAISLLTLSGYALYYAGNETVRDLASDFHLWLGVAAPALLFWHIRSGRNAVDRD